MGSGPLIIKIEEVLSPLVTIIFSRVVAEVVLHQQFSFMSISEKNREIEGQDECEH